MLSAEPGHRPASARAARSMLLSAQWSVGPHTSGGDPITVLDQLPPLPEGWDETGESAETVGSPEQDPAIGVRATLVESIRPAPDSGPAVQPLDQATAPTRTAPNEPSHGGPGARSIGAGSTGLEGWPAAAATAPIGTAGSPSSRSPASRPPASRPPGSQLPGSQPPGTQPPSSRPPSSQPPSSRPPASRPPASRPVPGRLGRRPWRAVVGAVTGLVLVAVVGLVLTRTIGTDPGNGTESPGSSVSTPLVTGSAAATTDAALRIGDACSWQVEGDRRTSTDGELVCAVDGGNYRWVAAPG